MHSRMMVLGPALALTMASVGDRFLPVRDSGTPGTVEVTREAVLQGATSDPAIVSWGAGRLDVFVRRPDNALWHKYYVNNAWSNWE